MSVTRMSWAGRRGLFGSDELAERLRDLARDFSTLAPPAEAPPAGRENSAPDSSPPASAVYPSAEQHPRAL